MKQKILIAVALGLSFASIGAVSQQSKPQQWEYKIEDRCFEEKRLNALGGDGWEMAGFSETDRGAWHCVFKRPR
jgi:hypothetical protein